MASTLNKSIDNSKQEIKKENYTPSGWLSWSTKLSAEFLGTLFLTWMIALLGVSFNGTKFEVLISYGLGGSASHLVIGFWVALDVLICLAVFSRWSCDLNPAVTTFRMIKGQHSKKYGFIKIMIQMLGGIFAGLAVWSTQEISHLVNGAIDSSTATNKNGNFINTWSAFTNTNFSLAGHTIKGGTASRHLLALGGEFIGGSILLWPIFTKSIKNAVVRDIVLVFAVGFGATSLLELGTVGWNPARTIGTNFIFDAVKGDTKAMQLYWAYLLGPILASFVFYNNQKIVGKYISPAWEKWIKIGQVKDK